MRIIERGGNSAIGDFQGSVIVSHDAHAGLDVNLTAFLLSDSGKVLGDSGIVFYNQPDGPGGMARHIAARDQGGVRTHQIDFNLRAAPAGVASIAVSLTLDSGGGFGQVRKLQAVLKAGGEQIALPAPALDAENGIIVLEIYVRNEQPKARAVWQGYASGLAGLCQHYGLIVADPEPAPAPAPPAAVAAPPALGKSLVSLTKPEQTHKVSLQKGGGAPAQIRVSVIWVDNGDGRDNDDLDLRIGILLPDGRMKLIQAPDKAGAFHQDPYVFHTGDVREASAKKEGKETVEINPEISRLVGGPVALVCSVYSAVSNGAVSVASLKPRMRMEYGDQVVECAFEFQKRFGSSFVYTYVIGIIQIDQDSISLKPSGMTSRAMSEATPWLVWDKGEVKLTMDGPAVFKGKPPMGGGARRYS